MQWGEIGKIAVSWILSPLLGGIASFLLFGAIKRRILAPAARAIALGSRGYDDAANGLSSYFVWLNRGKESVALDLTSDAGKAALTQLIDGADVLVQNLKPGALARMM